MTYLRLIPLDETKFADLTQAERDDLGNAGSCPGHFRGCRAAKGTALNGRAPPSRPLQVIARGLSLPSLCLIASGTGKAEV